MVDRIRRSDLELYGASIHIGYEVTQFHFTVERLAMNIDDRIDPRLHNSVLTAYLVFGRNLLKFFYDSKPFQDDVLAEDYYDDTSFWASVRPTPPFDFLKILKLSNKHALHLSYERVEVGELTWWNWSLLHPVIFRTLTEFRKTVPVHRLTPSVFETYDQMQVLADHFVRNSPSWQPNDVSP